MSKFKYLVIFLLISFITFLFYAYEEKDPVQLLYRLIKKQSSLLAKRYDMYPVGTTVGMPGGIIKKLGASFDKENISSLDEARRIIIDCGQEYLDAINSDEKLRPHLIQYPLTMKNIDVTIYLTDSDYDDEDNHLTVISVYKDNVFFYYKKKGERYGYSKEIEETYEEALEKVKASEKHT